MSLYKGNNLISGHQVLYSTTGNNTDGAMTQKATTTELNGKADTDLLNLSVAGQAVIDGQWVDSTLTIVNGSAKLGSYSFNLSSYLPNDGYNYEVIVSCDGSTLATSGAQADIRVTSSIISNNIFLAKTMTRTTQAVSFGGNCILPIGINRTLSYNIISSSLSNLRLWAVGYRRIGTNA